MSSSPTNSSLLYLFRNLEWNDASFFWRNQHEQVSEYERDHFILPLAIIRESLKFLYTEARLSRSSAFLLVLLLVAQLHMKSNGSAVPSDLKKSSSKNQQFLYYFTHSGFSNQLLGLQRASQLAHETNRTLILPPILPHFGTDPTFPVFQGRVAGAECVPYANSPLWTIQARSDAKACLEAIESNMKPPYAAYTEILDFQRIAINLGLSFIELEEFVKTEPFLVKKYFLDERPAPKIDLDGFCTEGSRDYHDMIRFFQRSYRNDTVAVIPSAYNVRNRNKRTKVFRKQFVLFPPSQKFSRLLRSAYCQLSSNYTSVHIRFEDELQFNCTKERKYWLLDELRIQQQGDGQNSIFLASSSPKATSCYQYFLSRNGFSTTTLQDLLSSSRTKHYMDAIQVQKGTLLLLMDQILASLGKRIVIDVRVGYSTFQALIQARHKLRHITLEYIGWSSSCAGSGSEFLG